MRPMAPSQQQSHDLQEIPGFGDLVVGNAGDEHGGEMLAAFDDIEVVCLDVGLDEAHEPRRRAFARRARGRRSGTSAARCGSAAPSDRRRATETWRTFAISASRRAAKRAMSEELLDLLALGRDVARPELDVRARLDVRACPRASSTAKTPPMTVAMAVSVEIASRICQRTGNAYQRSLSRESRSRAAESSPCGELSLLVCVIRSMPLWVRSAS